METKQPHPAGTGVGGMDNVVPQTPHYFIFIRYAQIVMTLVVFICGCVVASKIGGVAWGSSFGIFTGIWTGFFLAAVMLIPIYATNFYYKWAFLIAEGFCVIWWLITFAGLAWSASWLKYWADVEDAYSSAFRGSYNYYEGGKAAYGAAAAGAAFGAFNWIAFCVTFVLFGIACNNSRKAKQNYGGEGGVTSMGPIGAPAPAAQPTYDPNYQQQAYPTVPTPAPQQPYHQ